MNRDKAQQAINQIVEASRKASPDGGRRQYPASKKYIKQAEELGILDLIPNAPYSQEIGNTEIQLILVAATDSGHQVGGFNQSGEGDVTDTAATDLYNAINETEEEGNGTQYDNQTLLAYAQARYASRGETTSFVKVLRVSTLEDYVELETETAIFKAGFEDVDAFIAKTQNDDDTEEDLINTDCLELEYEVAQMEQDKYIAEMQTLQEAQETEEQSYASPLKPFLSTREVGELVGRAESTVRQTILRGALPATKIGNRWLIHRKDALVFWNK